jgi:arylsulfatase A-like enzyme
MNHDRQPGTRTFSVAIRLGDWKYVEHWGRWTALWPQRELYDLASDPGEDRNLVATRPDKAADLRGRILAELARRHIDPEKE